MSTRPFWHQDPWFRDNESLYHDETNMAAGEEKLKQLCYLNSSPPGQNGRHFADDIFKYVFFNENVRISIKFSPIFIPKPGPIDNNPALV